MSAEQRRKIIHVEDSAAIRDIVRTYLTQQYQADVIEVANGYEGFMRIVRELPHLVLLDYKLLDLNGMEIYTRMRANGLTRHIPVIMLSAEDIHRDDALEAGVNYFLTKPIDFHLLSKALDALLGTPTQPSLSPHDRQQLRRSRPSQPIALGALQEMPPDRVLSALGDYPTDQWTQVIRTYLKSDKGADRGKAVIALALWHQREASAPYQQTEGQRHFWRFVCHSLASTFPQEAVLRWHRLAQLGVALMRPAEQVHHALHKVFEKSGHWECRSWALDLLLRDQPQLAAQLAEAALRQDEHVDVRASAARVLEKVGAERHIVTLTRALNDPAHIVREHAALALGNIGSEAALLALEIALLDGRSDTAQAAVYGLTLCASAPVADLLTEAAAQRPEPPVLRELAHALGQLQACYPRCRAALHRLAAHPDDDVRLAAYRYVERMG